MAQVYHSNARTNRHSRRMIQQSKLSRRELADKLNIHVNTVAKWQSRDFVEDRSSRPKTIHYALSDLEQEIVAAVRTSTWMPIDDLSETVRSIIPHANRSNVYRVLRKRGISQVPQEERAKAKQFKAYEPGFLHIDVTYLPKLERKKRYLFVAIDRATRLMYYEIHDRKTAANAEAFLEACQAWFPFIVEYVLTDNGLEFTDRFAWGKKEPSGQHTFDKACKEAHIEHRLTPPGTPKTNGMVERANGIVKNATIKANEYGDIQELEKDLKRFLLYYTFHRRHSGLQRELKVRTPFEALQSWFETTPERFRISPEEFRRNAFIALGIQRGET